MFKKLVATIGGILAILAVLVGIKVLQIKTLIAAGASQTVPAEPVTTANVTKDNWSPTLDAVGSVAAVQGVTVAAEQDGKIVRIDFESGRVVKAGDLLIQQDVSIEEAQLRSAEATATLTKINLDRSRDLVSKNTISQSELDSADAQYKQAVAQADNYRAAIAKKTIRAPFAGRLGLRLVNLGQTLKSGDSIVSLQSLDPIYVNFSLPQQRLSELKRDLTVGVTGDTLNGRTVEGKITAINSEIDSATRNVRVQATLENKDELLRPGMFVNTSVVLPSNSEVLIIPATAVLYAPYGDSVYVVEDKKDEKTGQTQKVVRQQFVRLGARRGDFVAVTQGVKEGDTIVSSGVFKLRNGISVTVDNKLAPEAKLAPKPADS